jgi:hypothetical protein
VSAKTKPTPTMLALLRVIYDLRTRGIYVHSGWTCSGKNGATLRGLRNRGLIANEYDETDCPLKVTVSGEKLLAKGRQS